MIFLPLKEDIGKLSYDKNGEKIRDEIDYIISS